MKLRIGQGFDVHSLVVGRPLILAGVSIPFERGLAGHSDADVIIHAVVDALLGAAGLGDIGQHFSDKDPQWKNAHSSVFLRHTFHLLKEAQWEIQNIDVTLLAEAPKIAAYKDAMRTNIASDLNITASQVNLKATTTEKLGWIGREEGMACFAVALLGRVD